MMTISNKIFIALALIFFCQASFAQNSWYRGQVTNIVLSGPDGNFYIYLDNDTLQQTCAYNRVLWKVNDLGSERSKLAFSLALTALTTGKTFGVVVDLPAAGQNCYVSPTTSQGASIAN